MFSKVCDIYNPALQAFLSFLHMFPEIVHIYVQTKLW